MAGGTSQACKGIEHGVQQANFVNLAPVESNTVLTLMLWTGTSVVSQSQTYTLWTRSQTSKPSSPVHSDSWCCSVPRIISAGSLWRTIKTLCAWSLISVRLRSKLAWWNIIISAVYSLRPFKLAIFSMQFVDRDSLLDRVKHKSIEWQKTRQHVSYCVIETIMLASSLAVDEGREGGVHLLNGRNLPIQLHCFGLPHLLPSLLLLQAQRSMKTTWQ